MFKSIFGYFIATIRGRDKLGRGVELQIYSQ